MKLEKTLLKDHLLEYTFNPKGYVESKSNSPARINILNQVGTNRGGWGSTHNLEIVRLSKIPMVFFIGNFKNSSNYSVYEETSALAGYYSEFFDSEENFKRSYLCKDYQKKSIFKRYFCREKLSNDLVILKNEEDIIIDYKFIDFINIFEKHRAKKVDFAFYSNDRKGFLEQQEYYGHALKNKNVNLEFIQEDKTAYPYILHEYLRNKNQYLFSK